MQTLSRRVEELSALENTLALEQYKNTELAEQVKVLHHNSV